MISLDRRLQELERQVQPDVAGAEDEKVSIEELAAVIADADQIEDTYRRRAFVGLREAMGATSTRGVG